MKRIYSYLVVLSLSTILFSSCFKDIFCVDGRGETITEELTLDEFNGVELQEAARVTIIQGDVQKVNVTGKENIIDRLQTDVEGGIWEIDLGRECFNNLDLDIEITIPLLTEVHLSGSGRIEVGNFINQENLDISVTGSGEITLGSFSGTEDVDVRIAASGEVLINEAFPDLRTMNIELTASGVFDGYEMATDVLDARISGSGRIYTTVRESMNVRITGSGNLHYKGNPLIDANITGSGKIIDEN
jgi:hypothetical protein